MIKFSIVCPFHNSQKYLSETIQSVLRQTYGNFELILVDDCSTDRSPTICFEFSNNDSRIILLKNENNIGPFYSRVKGVSVATGDYLLFCDSDDLLASNLLSTLNRILTKKPYDIVLFDYTVDIGLLDTNNNSSNYFSNKAELIERLFVSDFSPNLFTKCFSKSLFEEEILHFNGRYSEDTFMLYNLAKRCDNMIYDSYYGYYYRENENSITHNLSFNDVLACWNFNNWLYVDISTILNRPISLSRRTLSHLRWSLFMVVWLTEEKQLKTIHENVCKDTLYELLKKSNKVRIGLLEDFVLKNFFRGKLSKISRIRSFYKRIKKK